MYVCPICREIFELKRPCSGAAWGKCSDHYDVFVNASECEIRITDRGNEKIFSSLDNPNFERDVDAAIREHSEYVDVNWQKEGF